MESETDLRKLDAGTVMTIRYLPHGSHIGSNERLTRQFTVNGMMGQIVYMKPVDGGVKHAFHIGDGTIERRGKRKQIVGQSAHITHMN